MEELDDSTCGQLSSHTTTRKDSANDGQLKVSKGALVELRTLWYTSHQSFKLYGSICLKLAIKQLFEMRSHRLSPQSQKALLFLAYAVTETQICLITVKVCKKQAGINGEFYFFF